MRTLASFLRYLLDQMVSLRHPDILEALIAWWCSVQISPKFAKEKPDHIPMGDEVELQMEACLFE